MYGQEIRLEVPPNLLAEERKSKNSDQSRSVDKDVRKTFYYAKPLRVDILVKSNDKNGGLGCPLLIHKLWARCSCQTGIDPNCWCNVGITKGQARSLLNCILQGYDYLVLAKVRYGVLTDIQNWYLFKRDHSDYLYISVGFKWKNRQPHLPAAIAYLISTSVNASGEFDVPPEEGERPWSWDVTPYTSPSGGSKDDDDDKDTPYEPSENEMGDCKRTQEANSNSRQKQLQEILASDLHLDDRPISSEGWSGCVVGGRLNDSLLQ
ncbi:uncharacterized protein [Physcomitrium patens]|uniref:uncharacterized protein isoform X2 n=1 Tax=Physcomitrium patens TaxID=3218 RepID=UPI000D172EB3|nr:uncharacterized protein LOC112292090 isoform X2 [Physcomitrium patens]|eukprot:XP_024396011.1 uncharacterized protein LOC112292090 isoform X2 [Physcomitrella patens]